MKKRNKQNIQKTIGVVLLITALFSSYFLARYISSFDGADDTSVAKWSVETAANTDELNLVSGNNVGVYILTITSASEVSASYSVILSNIPNGMEVKIDNGAYQMADDGGSIVFDNVGVLSMGNNNGTNIHNLTFNSPLGTNIPSINEVDVDVRFVQVD